MLSTELLSRKDLPIEALIIALGIIALAKLVPYVIRTFLSIFKDTTL